MSLSRRLDGTKPDDPYKERQSSKERLDLVELTSMAGSGISRLTGDWSLELYESVQ
jgi:hypothetical protein